MSVGKGRPEEPPGMTWSVFQNRHPTAWDACFEAHKKYIDVQVMLDGSEIIATEHIDKMHQYDCIQPFGDGDLELYANNNDCVDNVLNKGDFLVLYPEDGHMPGVCIAEPKQVKKAVIKVPVK